jgi:hypothetical protein
MSAAELERSPERQKLAERIAEIGPARERERALLAAIEAAQAIEQAAAQVLEDRQQALEQSGRVLAGQLVAAAAEGSAHGAGLLPDPQGAAIEVAARADLVAAQAALAELESELTEAQAANAQAEFDLGAAVQGVLLAHVAALTREGERIKAELGRVLDDILSIEKVGGLSHPDRPWTPFPLPLQTREALFNHRPDYPRLDARAASWRDFAARLRADADAQIARS